MLGGALRRRMARGILALRTIFVSDFKGCPSAALTFVGSHFSGSRND
jgi:hypothetical protein